MKTMIVLAAVLLVGLGQGVLADQPGRDVTALEQKMVGAWKGQTGCDGRLVLRSDGTYELTGFGPAPYDSAGAWKVRWDALPPTLVLTCRTSEVEEEVGTTLEVKLIKLDNKSLAIEYAEPNGSPSGQYTREKK